MSPLASEADAVRLVEDVIAATSDRAMVGRGAVGFIVPTDRTGSAVIEALIEAGWVPPYSVPEPTAADARVLDRAGDTWERVPSGAWRLYLGHAPVTWEWLVSTWGPLRLAPPRPPAAGLAPRIDL